MPAKELGSALVPVTRELVTLRRDCPITIDLDGARTARFTLPSLAPVFEDLGLFVRGVGETTDVVSKEMYTFLDRNDESLTLRPEATAGIVRAGITNGLLHNQKQKLWTTGPMFRYDKPQKGRYRQFYQLDLEAFGIAAPYIDVQIIHILHLLFQRLGITDRVRFLPIEHLFRSVAPEHGLDITVPADREFVLYALAFAGAIYQTRTVSDMAAAITRRLKFPNQIIDRVSPQAEFIGPSGRHIHVDIRHRPQIERGKHRGQFAVRG